MWADPNFLVIGAQKCGTSWISRTIGQHPEVFASPVSKELHFFDQPDNYSNGIEWYRRLFEGYQGQKMVGEFTPNYIWVPKNDDEYEDMNFLPDIPRRVHSYFPDLKLIVSLRDPVRRAISAYFHHMHAGCFSPWTPISEVWDRYGIISMGYYHHHLTEWLKYFSMDQFLFLIFEEDIVTNKMETKKRLYRFLEIDEEYLPANFHRNYNPTRGSLYLYFRYYLPLPARILGRLFPRIRLLQGPRIEASEQEQDYLKSLYHKDIHDLEQLLGCNLPWYH